MKKLIGLAVILFLVLGACAGLGAALEDKGSDRPAALAEQQNRYGDGNDPTPTTAKLDGIGDGTWEVGVDIKAGKYKTAGPAPSAFENCYWERQKTLEGGFDAILSNDNLSGPGVVVIKKTDKGFKTSGCQPWIRQK